MFKSIRNRIFLAQVVIILLVTLAITGLGYYLMKGQLHKGQVSALNLSADAAIPENAVIVFVVILGVSIIISWKLSSIISEPITELSRAAHMIARGDLSQKVPGGLSDETGIIANSFRQVTEALQKAKISCMDLKGQNDFLNHVLTSIPYPFFVLNAADFTVKLSNSAASGAVDFKNMPCYEVANISDLPCVGDKHGCSLRTISDTRKPVVMECLHHDRNDNNIYYEIHAHPIFNDRNEVTEIIEYFIDKTVSKRNEVEIILYAEKLRISNREFQEFSYVASHDLQEPLRKVSVFGDRLKTSCGGSLDEKGKDYLERMLSATKRMQNLINGLLAFCHVTTKAQPFVHVELSEIIKDVLSDLEVRVEQTGGRVEVEDLPALDADPLQMRQLFQNLIGNSLKFHKKDEPPVVKITGNFIDIDENNPIVVLEDGKPYQITVTDNGIGFDEQYAERIFGVFQRLHGRQEYEGTGIGLSVCKKIVERHGGTIIARSIPGEGTTFIIILPVKQSKSI
jgi:signal transduction histidine kinase/HAMP domain-containing protein